MKFHLTRFRLLRPFVATVAFAALALGAHAAGYLKIGDIKGEATDAGHKDWINLLSVSQSITRSMSTSTTGLTRLSVQLGDFVVVKELDKASPKLMESICLGTVIPMVEIDLYRSTPSGATEPYLKYELKNVIVTSYSVGGATDGGQIPTEEVSLNFEEIKATYLSSSDGGNVEFEWKVEEGTR